MNMSDGDERTDVRVGPITAPAPPRAVDGADRAADSGDLARRLSVVFPAVLAFPALSLPLAWPVVCILVATLLATARRMPGDGDLASAPTALLATVGAGLRGAAEASIARLIPTLFGVAATIVAATVLAAGLPALRWLAVEGTNGVLVAARLGWYEHLPGLLSAALCWRLLRGPEDGRARFSGLLDALNRTGEGALASLAVGAVLLALLFAFVVPSSTFWPKESFADVASILPGATEGAVLDLQASVVDEEVSAVLSCLASRDKDVGWVASGVSRMGDGGLSLRIRREDPPPTESSRRDVSVLVLALHNELPHAVERISIRRRADFDPLIIHRSRVHLEGPARSTRPLAAAAGVGTDVLPTSDASVDAALLCAASAL
jgi:hypothetical protein